MDGIGLLFLGGMFVVMWLFFIRPQQKQAQQAKDFQAGIDKGARVVTTGGIHGKIIKVDDNSVMLEIDNNVKIRIEKSGISMEMSQTAYGADTEKKSDTPAAK
jgi:preprotein translocase subunit YajC